MKVHTKIVYEWVGDKLVCVEDESYDYSGPISECKGGGSQTTVQKNDPPEYLAPFLTDIASQAQNQFRTHTPTFFPGQSVAPFSPETEQALQLQTQRALTGSPVTSSARDNALATLQGDFLYGNPGFNRAVEAATNYGLPRVDSMFGGAGRLRSGLADTARASVFADAFANQYGQERTRQMQALGLSPALASQDYADIGQLAAVGGQREGLQQDLINAAMQRHNFEQNLPYSRLGQYAGLIQGQNLGGVSTTSQPLYRNRAAGVAGGAVMGSYFGPLGSVAGGILGGLL